uniref:Uncharacterized protein n=1 Tax=Hanusia phi TaxID=3032 RepID=A0A7S0HD59_9CRYP
MAGLYFGGTYMPKSYVLYLLIATSCLLACVFIASIASSSGRGKGMQGALYMQVVFTLFVALLPSSFMLQPYMLKAVRSSHRTEALELHRVGLLALYAALSTLIAFFIRLRVSQMWLEQGKGSRHDVALRQRGVQSRVQAMEDNDWLASLGNISALLAFVLCMWLNLGYMNGNPASVFVLAPLLLLLSQDNGLFRSLSDKQRYFPVVAVSLAFLVSSAMFELLLRGFLEKHHLIHRSKSIRMELTSTIAVAKNLAMLALTIPGHVMFAGFLWNFRHSRDFYWVILLPLNALPVILADLQAVRLLGVLGVVAGILQLFLSYRIRKFGLQFV